MSNKTKNLNLNKPDYASGRWDKEINENFDIIDQAVTKALDGQGGYHVGEEAPLNPRYGQVWIDTTNGLVDGNAVTGRYKVYSGDTWEEFNFVIDGLSDVKLKLDKAISTELEHYNENLSKIEKNINDIINLKTIVEDGLITDEVNQNKFKLIFKDNIPYFRVEEVK